jgi:hypothetical protein
MAALVWDHGTTAESAKTTVQAELRKHGQADNVRWNGNAFKASVGFGVVLSVAGRITDGAIILDECSGAMAGFALDKTREVLSRLFPAGKT